MKLIHLEHLKLTTKKRNRNETFQLNCLFNHCQKKTIIYFFLNFTCFCGLFLEIYIVGSQVQYNLLYLNCYLYMMVSLPQHWKKLPQKLFFSKVKTRVNKSISIFIMLHFHMHLTFEWTLIKKLKKESFLFYIYLFYSHSLFT